jgi:phenylalanyl-tRNA synthetase beta chain
MRDLAFVVENKILYNDLKKEISGFNPLIKTVELFDVYIGNKLAGGKKSLAFHINYQAEERTLTAAEVDKIQSDLVACLEEKFEAKLRDF